LGITQQDTVPDLSDLCWVLSMFTSGMGIGLLYFGYAGLVSLALSLSRSVSRLRARALSLSLSLPFPPSLLLTYVHYLAYIVHMYVQHLAYIVHVYVQHLAQAYMERSQLST